jgi:hypothetical protein
VTPGHSALTLKWTRIDKSFPLKGYLVEYGVKDGQYTEQRLVSAAADTMTLGDLLNGITYFVRLTPVTVTDESLADLADRAQGTPTGIGVHFSPSDPLPFDPELHGGAPRTPASGIPPAGKWIGGAALAGAAFIWLRRRKAMKQQIEFLRAVGLRYGR